MDGIWGASVWLGGFLIFVAIMMLSMKVLKMVDSIMSSSSDKDHKYWIFMFLKYFPFFIIVIPIINLLTDVVMGADGIEDMTISSMAYEQLIVNQAPMVAGFIIAWTLIYILTLMAFEKTEVNH